VEGEADHVWHGAVRGGKLPDLAKSLGKAQRIGRTNAVPSAPAPRAPAQYQCFTAQEVHDAFARYDRPDARFRVVITPRS
jgi:hypothetical protein